MTEVTIGAVSGALATQSGAAFVSMYQIVYLLAVLLTVTGVVWLTSRMN